MRAARITALGLVVFALLLQGLYVPVAHAQGQQGRAQQRYDRVAKGANVEEWHKRLSDDDAAVRLEAVDSLGKDGSEASVEALLEATADPDERVRLKAFDFLGTIGSPTATPSLAQNLFLTNVDRASKLHVLIALGRIKDPRAANPLMNFCKNNSDEELRTAAVYALGEIGAVRSVSGLEEIRDTTESEKLKRITGDALAKISNKVAARPNTQPTMLEMEKFFRAQGQQKQRKR